MRLAQVQFSSWDKAYNFSAEEQKLEKGDKVVVETELGMEVGEVTGFSEAKNDITENSAGNEKAIKPILRKATAVDLQKLTSEEDKKKAIKVCKEMIVKYNLEMKLVDVHFSFDGSRITFAFIADGRVDFRELVKDLTRFFSRNIRLYQIGIRDEAKFMGDCGHCGRGLCCQKILGDLSSITSEMAEVQQCVHRGSDRISGICGRLMCCLAYEEKGYQDLFKNLPPIGAKVNVDGRRGEVVGHQILKQVVNVKFYDENGKLSNVIEAIDINRKKK